MLCHLCLAYSALPQVNSMLGLACTAGRCERADQGPLTLAPTKPSRIVSTITPSLCAHGFDPSEAAYGACTSLPPMMPGSGLARQTDPGALIPRLSDYYPVAIRRQQCAHARTRFAGERIGELRCVPGQQ